MFVEVILTLALLTGLVILYLPDIEAISIIIKQKIMFSINNLKASDVDFRNIPKTNGLNDSVRRLLYITFDFGSKNALIGFWIVSIVIPIMVFFVMSRIATVGISLSLCIFVALMPTVFVLGKLQSLRIQSSKEGKIMLTELLDNYKIYYFNMQQAIEVTATTIEDAPKCKRLLFNLSKGLNRVSGGEDLKELLNDFKFSIGTSWAAVLTDNMYFALSHGIKVTSAMEDLIKIVAKAEEVEEKAVREHNESGLILKYLIPSCYILTILGAVFCFDLTLAEFFHYQFGTTAGVSWFTTSLIIYFSGLIAKWFLTCSKLDL
jgi:hypothetical protein